MSCHQPVAFGNSEKERETARPYVLPTPRILLIEIHLGRAMPYATRKDPE